MEKKRCFFQRNAQPLKCTVCQNGKTKNFLCYIILIYNFLLNFNEFLVHYRTRRTFRSNLRIITNINLTLARLLVGYSKVINLTLALALVDNSLVINLTLALALVGNSLVINLTLALALVGISLVINLTLA